MLESNAFLPEVRSMKQSSRRTNSLTAIHKNSQENHPESPRKAAAAGWVTTDNPVDDYFSKKILTKKALEI